MPKLKPTDNPATPDAGKYRGSESAVARNANQRDASNAGRHLDSEPVDARNANQRDESEVSKHRGSESAVARNANQFNESDAEKYGGPDKDGHFGPYGGIFVGETLMAAVEELAQAYRHLADDEGFQRRFHTKSHLTYLNG